jgi:hypothetical protein
MPKACQSMNFNFGKLIRRYGLVGHVYNSHFNKDSSDIIILATIPRSGTTFLRYILTNYLRLLQSPDAAPVTYEEMHRQLFPNRKVYRPPITYLPPSNVMDVVAYRDIYNTHKIHRSLASSHAKIVFLYRNPLDNLVSRYYYKYKYRPTQDQASHSIEEIIDLELPHFIADYSRIKHVCRRSDRALALAYENLTTDPFGTARELLTWLAIKVDPDLLRKAVEFSSFDQVRKEEERVGPIGAPKGFRGYFTRSGKIGQWKDHFDRDQLARITSRLKKGGISLDEFVLE